MIVRWTSPGLLLLVATLGPPAAAQPPARGCKATIVDYRPWEFPRGQDLAIRLTTDNVYSRSPLSAKALQAARRGALEGVEKGLRRAKLFSSISFEGTPQADSAPLLLTVEMISLNQGTSFRPLFFVRLSSMSVQGELRPRNATQPLLRFSCRGSYEDSLLSFISRRGLARKNGEEIAKGLSKELARVLAAARKPQKSGPNPGAAPAISPHPTLPYPATGSAQPFRPDPS